MNEKQTLVNRILTCALKFKSILYEDDVVEGSLSELMLFDMFPYLTDSNHKLAFNGLPPIPAICTKLLDSPEITSGNLRNLFYLCKKSEGFDVYLFCNGVDIDT